MHAYEIPGLRFSMPAGGAVALNRFVSVSGEAAVQANATTAIIGASINEVTAAEFEKNERIVEIADGIVTVEAAGAITSGTTVYSNAEGKAASTGTVAAGVAITAATAAGQLIAVKI